MAAVRRRSVSVSGLFLAAILLPVTAPLWVPVSTLVDLVRGRGRLPTLRLLTFALCWAWLESAGVLGAAALWCIGRARRHQSQYALQRWWAARLMTALRVTTGIRVEVADADAAALRPGPAVLLCRHASLADSLLSAWIITSLADMHPRYVLKRELLADPCLDIVGNRLPNHFLDRGADDSSTELAALRRLGADMGTDDIAVIFPEGTRASPTKRERALARIAERQPDRAALLGALRHLLPPRPAGSAALVEGAPHADVVIGWHVGFDGLDTFGGILRHLTRTPPPVRFQAVRIPREQVPTGEGFTAWLDDQWVRADAAVERLLSVRSEDM